MKKFDTVTDIKKILEHIREVKVAMVEWSTAYKSAKNQETESTTAAYGKFEAACLKIQEVLKGNGELFDQDHIRTMTASFENLIRVQTSPEKAVEAQSIIDKYIKVFSMTGIPASDIRAMIHEGFPGL